MHSNTSHVTCYTSHITCYSSHVTRHTLHSSHTAVVSMDHSTTFTWGMHASHVTRHTPHVTRHTSHITRHMSHVTSHTSHLTPHTSHLTPITLFCFKYFTPHTPQAPAPTASLDWEPSATWTFLVQVCGVWCVVWCVWGSVQFVFLNFGMV